MSLVDIDPAKQGTWIEGLEVRPLEDLGSVVASGAIAIGVIGTIVILKILDLTIGLRVKETDEMQGLDVSQHGEEGYIVL